MSNEIITVAQMRAVDAAAAKLAPPRTLMENAGRAVAEAIAKRHTPRATTIVCGPGANGGDGWVAARVLKAMDWPVSVLSLVPRAALAGDAADAARLWDGAIAEGAQASQAAELYVDAMFGAGLSRALSGEAARFASMMAAAPERVVAVDLPSGLDGDTGKALGEVCARAALTITFVRKKPAHVLMPGRALCGEVIVADIGAPESALRAERVSLFENGPPVWGGSFPWPSLQTHKHARGHVIVASGARAHTGAARLAARAALRVGAGLVTVLSPSEALDENAAHLSAIMLSVGDDADAFVKAAQTAQGLTIGPAFGMGEGERAKLDAALAAKDRCAIVIDADAITMLSPLRRQLDARDVLTPHVGEFKRAFPDLLAASPSRVEAARSAARAAGCVVLLKGPDTVIAAPDGRAVVNTTGGPFLATAGSGDVLSGFISGLIGQGMASFEAAAAGAWLHGQCGEAFGPGLIAEDLPEILPRVLSALASAGASASPRA